MSGSGDRGAGSAGALLRWQFRLAHALLEGAVERLSLEAVQRRRQGTTTPAEACYAQIVLCEDVSVNVVLAGGMPLALSSWVGRTGLSDLPPLVWATSYNAWAGQVRLDLGEMRAYARAVYASTDAYLTDLPDEALDTACSDTPARLLTALLLTLSMRRGEISCLLALERRPTTEESNEQGGLDRR